MNSYKKVWLENISRSHNISTEDVVDIVDLFLNSIDEYVEILKKPYEPEEKLYVLRLILNVQSIATILSLKDVKSSCVILEGAVRSNIPNLLLTNIFRLELAKANFIVESLNNYKSGNNIIFMLEIGYILKRRQILPQETTDIPDSKPVESAGIRIVSQIGVVKLFSYLSSCTYRVLCDIDN